MKISKQKTLKLKLNLRYAYFKVLYCNCMKSFLKITCKKEPTSITEIDRKLRVSRQILSLTRIAT